MICCDVGWLLKWSPMDLENLIFYQVKGKPFNCFSGADLQLSPGVWKSNGEWRLTVDYRGLNEVTPLMSAAMPDMLELQNGVKGSQMRARIGNPNCPGILDVITDWPEGKDFGMSPEEEVTCAEETPQYNKLPENENPYALFTDGSCCIVGKHWRWKAAVWSPTRRVAEAAEGEGELSQFAEMKAIQLALDIAEREKWPTLYLYTDS
ncbi:ribonuclease H-like [Grus japonensis]|uniref:Ribonuclease H-like n=1 Tax=Grus japonensis TaxID=30415 RepID=A0ABC9W9P4_GRUJA